MQYQLPPHGFWIKQTGGMSVLDVLFLATVVMLNTIWFVVGMTNFNKRYAAGQRVASVLSRVEQVSD